MNPGIFAAGKLLIDAAQTLATKGWKSKQVIFGTLLSLFGGLYVLMPELAPIFGPYAGQATIGIGSVVTILRLLTNAPLEEK